MEQILFIKDLLHAKRFTIEGARKFMESSRKETSPESRLFEDVREELENIRELLD